ncbi:MAG: hypothetical protein AAF802_26170 [Planctomycetota bacterium]
MRQFNRITSITLILLATALSYPSLFNAANADEGTASVSIQNESLLGTWRMATSSISGSNAGAAAGINTRLKIFNDTHWVLVQPDPESGKTVFVHGGTYDFDGSFLKETVEFAGEDTLNLVGKTLKFRIVFSKESYEQIDPNSVFSETWKRTKQCASNDANIPVAKAIVTNPEE